MKGEQCVWSGDIARIVRKRGSPATSRKNPAVSVRARLAAATTPIPSASRVLTAPQTGALAMMTRSGGSCIRSRRLPRLKRSTLIRCGPSVRFFAGTLDLTFIPGLGFRLRLRRGSSLSENCTRKRLAWKLMDKSLILLRKLQDEQRSRRSGRLTSARSWLTRESEIIFNGLFSVHLMRKFRH